MKTLIHSLLLSFSLLSLFSCEKDYIIDENPVEYQSMDHPTTQRSSGVGCLSCDAITVSQQLLTTNGQCSTTLLSVELTDTDCNAGTRHIVKVNGEPITFFTSRLLEIELEHCDDVPSTITVHGYDTENDNWDLVCYRQQLATGNQFDELAPTYELLAIE